MKYELLRVIAMLCTELHTSATGKYGYVHMYIQIGYICLCLYKIKLIS